MTPDLHLSVSCVKKRQRQRCLLAIIFVAVLLLCPYAIAGSTSLSVASEYTLRQWTASDGLPVNSINALAFSDEGYLWLATFDGLVRFDGSRFVSFRTTTLDGMPSNRLLDVQSDRNGRLWILAESGAVAWFDGERFSALDLSDGLPDARVRRLAFAADGEVWLATHGGLARWQQGRIESVLPEQLGGLVSALALSNDQIIAATAERACVLAKDLSARCIDLDWRAGEPLGLLLDSHNHLWVGNGLGLQRFDLNTGQRLVDSALTALDDKRVFAINSDGTHHWLRTDAGVYLYDGAGLTRVAPGTGYLNGREPLMVETADGWMINTLTSIEREGAPIMTLGSRITDTHLDAEGSLWVGSESEGLLQLRPSPFKTVGQSEGLFDANVYSVMEDQQKDIWLGTLGNGLVRVRNGQVVQQWRESDGLPSDIVWALHQDRQGAIWVGNLGICQIVGARCERTDSPRELDDVTVRAIFEDRHERLWIGSDNGIWSRDNNGWRHFGAAAGVPPYSIRAIIEDRFGRLWFGSNGGGVAVFEQGQFDLIGRDTGLPSDLIRGFYEDERGGMWLATEDQGLVLIENAAAPVAQLPLHHISVADGLYDDSVHAVLTDAEGRLWASTNRGLFWVLLADLYALVAGTTDQVSSMAYDERDGLRSREANGGVQPAAWRTEADELWFATQAGAVRVDTAALPHNPVPPGVVIEKMVAGNQGFSAGQSLSAAQRSVTFEYTAITFLKPEQTRFRYRLEPLEPVWIDAGARRLASYSNLAPGEYEFFVSAANASGIWDQSDASVRFSIAPRLVETTLFKVLVVLALIGVGIALGIGRVQMHARQRRRLKREVDERTAQLASSNEALSGALDQVKRQADRLRALGDQRNRMFADISHELRTPLGLILAPLEDAERGQGAMDQQLPRLLRNARRLKRLVDQTLDLQQLDIGEFQLERRWLDAGALVDNLIAEFRPLAERYGITLRRMASGFDGQVFADQEQLEKILTNLLSNALKYGKSGGWVEVGVDSHREQMRISVRDNGFGIADDDIHHIFDRHFRASHPASSYREGSGIGLALARQLARLHGGDILVESQLGKGSCFTFQMPAVQQMAVDRGETVDDASLRSLIAPANSSVAMTTKDQPLILIVDDNFEMREYLAELLSSAYKVAQAADGTAGVAAARSCLPDLIITDFMMPGIDGIGLVRALKSETLTECIPILMLTARATTRDELAGLSSGADDYLSKPFSPAVLLARVKALFTAQERLKHQLNQHAQKRIAAQRTPARSLTLRQRLEQLISDHIAAGVEFDANSLASGVGLSRSQLHRRLQAEGAGNITSLMMEQRLLRAGQLLDDRAGSVSEVAYAVGFKSLSHFSQAYKKRFGHSPSAQLKQNT